MARFEAVIAAKNPTYEALATYRAGECAAGLEQWDASLAFNKRVLDRFPDFDLRPEGLRLLDEANRGAEENVLEG